MKKILLIGSAPNALLYKAGSIIDDFDGSIVRFNACKVKGFESFVGSRTDILSLWNPNIQVAKNKKNKLGNSWISEETFLSETNPNKLYITGLHVSKEAKKIIRSAGKRFNIPVEEIPQTANELAAQELKEIKNRIKTSGGTRPSNGLIMACHFLQDKENQVYYYGFSHFDRSKDLHYYHEGQWHKNSFDYKSHTPQVEKVWFEEKCVNSNLKKFIPLPGL